MALITPQQTTIAGTVFTLNPVNSSDTFAPDQNLFLSVWNNSGSAITVTFTDAGKTPGGSAATNPTSTVSAAQTKEFGPIPRSFADPTTGLITVSYSSTASVAAALKRI